MTLLGWLFLIFSWGVIIGLCAYCFSKLTNPSQEPLHSPLDIEADIEEEEGEEIKIHPTPEDKRAQNP